MHHIHHCPACKKYTLKDTCPSCQQRTEIARPPKFSLQDKYTHLLREAKKEQLQKKGLY